MKWSTIKMYEFGTNMWGTLITGTLFKPFSTGIENINHIGGNRTKEAKKRRNCQAFSFRWPCQISCKYCWTTYWEMAIFCSLAIKVSMKLVSLSSREFRMAPGDSIFAARKKKKEWRNFGTFLLSFRTIQTTAHGSFHVRTLSLESLGAQWCCDAPYPSEPFPKQFQKSSQHAIEN